MKLTQRLSRRGLSSPCTLFIYFKVHHSEVKLYTVSSDLVRVGDPN